MTFLFDAKFYFAQSYGIRARLKPRVAHKPDLFQVEPEIPLNITEFLLDLFTWSQGKLDGSWLSLTQLISFSSHGSCNGADS